MSPFVEKAVADARTHGNAVLKFISSNDVGGTGGHQCGYYLPKAVWQQFTKVPPTKGANGEEQVSVLWQDGRETKSCIHWYGVGTRSEYRITRFGRDFPWLDEDCIGDLLVLIRVEEGKYRAYVLGDSDGIEELEAALGVSLVEKSWAAFDSSAPLQESPEDCVERKFREFCTDIEEFPSGQSIADFSRQAIRGCDPSSEQALSDDRLMRWLESEYRLFRMIERKLCQHEIVRVFKSVDDFLSTASRIMNRRKARAGRSFENHIEEVLTTAKIPHEMQPDIDGRPDVVIPSAAAYHDAKYPSDRIMIVGLKTTCKDRWRQVLNEGRRITNKHLITLQHGISGAQIREMLDRRVTLIVPKPLHTQFPRDERGHLLTVEAFLERARKIAA